MRPRLKLNNKVFLVNIMTVRVKQFTLLFASNDINPTSDKEY
jgi:hypothetical protein